ncbi:MAG: cache domain-containing protein, partial [Alphaproteobacteria bacterium]|nr:cache domain-containing protein [Alphaproteobacteria bacterium]
PVPLGTERQVALAAGDRLFQAYLNTASLGEAARLQPRIKALLATLIGRYGIREVSVADRAGALLARTGNYDRTVASLDPAADPLMFAGLAAAPHRASTRQDGLKLHVIAPVVIREQSEFVIDARQDLSSYHTALAHGLSPDRFTVLTDPTGVILADSRGATGGTAIVAKLTLAAIRRAAPKGHGEIVGGENRYRVAHRQAGDWTIIAVERVPAPRRCHAEGARLCG